MPMPPATGRIVRYRGRQGLCAVRAAIVTADVDTLDPDGVKIGAVPGLDSAQHVHLWVFTPGHLGGFHEYNVAPGTEPGTWHWPDIAEPGAVLTHQVAPAEAEQPIGARQAANMAAKALEEAGRTLDPVRQEALANVSDKWRQLALTLDSLGRP